MWPTDFLYPTFAEHIVPFFGQSVPFAADGNDAPTSTTTTEHFDANCGDEEFHNVFCFLFLFAGSQIFKGGRESDL